MKTDIQIDSKWTDICCNIIQGNNFHVLLKCPQSFWNHITVPQFCGTLINLKNHNFYIKLIFRHYSSWFSQLDIWICSPVSFPFTIQQWNACSFSSHLSPFTFATSNSDQLITKKAISKFDSGLYGLYSLHRTDARTGGRFNLPRLRCCEFIINLICKIIF